MSAQFPVRDAARQREAASELFFQDHLPRAWLCEKPQNDYGIDLRVGVVEGDQVAGLEFVVQLKSSATPSNREDERVILNVSTYNYLMDSLSVAMVVKYIASEREAYWVLLRDVPPPSSQSQQSFTVRVPRANRVSDINWQDLKDRLGGIHGLKLRAGRREAGNS